jgi:hypothetical protein
MFSNKHTVRLKDNSMVDIIFEVPMAARVQIVFFRVFAYSDGDISAMGPILNKVN